MSGQQMQANEAAPEVERLAGPRVEITYCTQCQWLLRAGWMAQEVLSTFGQDLGEVALRPASGGTFRISVDGVDIWERKRDGGFPDAKVLKQRIRDQIAPERDLGHIDGKHVFAERGDRADDANKASDATGGA